MGEARDSKINLCDTCIAGGYTPECGGEDIEFGDGFGNDNVVSCSGYQNKEIPGTKVSQASESATVEKMVPKKGSKKFEQERRRKSDRH